MSAEEEPIPEPQESESPTAEAPAPDGPARPQLRDLPRWKRNWLVTAAAFLVIGFGLSGYGLLFGSSSEQDPGQASQQMASSATGEGGAAAGLASGLVAGGEQGGTSPGSSEAGEAGAAGETEGLAGWSPFFLKGGFGLFLGFCIGYALRTFFKLALFFLGLFFLLMIGLESLDVITVNWQVMEGFYDDGVARLQQDFGAFKSFVTGSLPTTGLTATGLFAGFKKG